MSEFQNLKKQLGAIQYIDSHEELEPYSHDWTKYYQSRPGLVVYPTSTEEVSKVMRLCNELELPVVPSGGRTGLSGGAMANNDEVILSLERLNKIGEVDQSGRSIWVEAGAITKSVQEKVNNVELQWPISFAAEGSSHIGGNISTNAGGIHVIRYGMTRNWVLGVTAVLMSGEIIHANGNLQKNNTGYNFCHLFTGSEGTLGVITEAYLKLTTLPKKITTMFLAIPNLKIGNEILSSLTKYDLYSFEYLDNSCFDLVSSKLERSLFEEDYKGDFLLIEIEGNDTVIDGWLGSNMEEGKILNGIIAQSSKEADIIWSIRENISEEISHQGIVHKNDISVPVSKLSEFILQIKDTYKSLYPEFKTFIFGHLGDGNIHLNTVKPNDMELSEFKTLTSRVDQEIFTLVQSFKGSISAEHGVGLLKKEYLSFSKSKQEIELMKEIKRAFDPKGLLNPSKII